MTNANILPSMSAIFVRVHMSSRTRLLRNVLQPPESWLLLEASSHAYGSSLRQTLTALQQCRPSSPPPAVGTEYERPSFAVGNPTQPTPAAHVPPSVVSITLSLSWSASLHRVGVAGALTRLPVVAVWAGTPPTLCSVDMVRGFFVS
jgi:hypothetical protein